MPLLDSPELKMWLSQIMPKSWYFWLFYELFLNWNLVLHASLFKILYPLPNAVILHTVCFTLYTFDACLHFTWGRNCWVKYLVQNSMLSSSNSFYASTLLLLHIFIHTYHLYLHASPFGAFLSTPASCGLIFYPVYPLINVNSANLSSLVHVEWRHMRESWNIWNGGHILHALAFWNQDNLRFFPFWTFLHFCTGLNAHNITLQSWYLSTGCLLWFILYMLNTLMPLLILVKHSSSDDLFSSITAIKTSLDKSRLHLFNNTSLFFFFFPIH